MSDRYYPQKKDYPQDSQWQDMRRAFDLIYGHTDELAKLPKPGNGAKLKVMPKQPTGLGTAEMSQINGLNVKSIPPLAGQAPTYNAATGQFEHATPAGAIAAPATSAAPGINGQIATDGTYLYVYSSTAGAWKRITLAAF